jgi:hypothetical protein
MEFRLYLIYISNAYLNEVKFNQIKSKILPKVLAVPLYTISKRLGVKIGFGI